MVGVVVGGGGVWTLQVELFAVSTFEVLVSYSDEVPILDASVATTAVASPGSAASSGVAAQTTTCQKPSYLISRLAFCV